MVVRFIDQPLGRRLGKTAAAELVAVIRGYGCVQPCHQRHEGDEPLRDEAHVHAEDRHLQRLVQDLRDSGREVEEVHGQSCRRGRRREGVGPRHGTGRGKLCGDGGVRGGDENGVPLAVPRACPPQARWVWARGRETIDARRAET